MSYYDSDYIEDGYFEKPTLTPTESIVTIHRKVYIATINDDVNLTDPYIEDGYIEDDYYIKPNIADEPYIESGYCEAGYYGDVFYKDITELVTKLEITREVGKAFSVLNLDMSGYDIPKDFIRDLDIRLFVELGETVYKFVLFDVDSDYRLNSKVVGKTQGCLLDIPFSKKYDDIFLGNSNDVLLELTKDIECDIKIPEFDFNEGSFKLNGSKLDGLKRLAGVAGSSVYVFRDTLILDKPLVVTDDFVDFVFNDVILTSKDKTNNYDGSLHIDKVLFNVDDTNLTTEPLITMTYLDGCTRPKFLLNPTPKSKDEITSNLGTFQLTNFRQLYTGSITNTNSIKVSGGILEIFSVTIGGLIVSNSNFEVGKNVILLDGVFSGVVEVSYLTRGISLYTTNGKLNFQDKNKYYELIYLNQKLSATIPLCANVVESDGLNDFSITLVNEKITLDTPTVFDIIGEVKNLALVSDKLSGVFKIVNGYYAYGNFNTSFMNGITKVSGVEAKRTFTTSFENVSGLVNGVTNNIYGFFTTPDIHISETFVGSTIVPLSKDTTNADYNLYYTTNSSFSGYSTTATYIAIVDRWTIPTVGGSNLVRFIDWYSEDSIYTYKYPDPTNGTYASICKLPAEIELNISDLIDINPVDLAGERVYYDGKPYIINPIGVIKIPVTKAESIDIDTSFLRKGSKITIDSSNSEVAT